MIWRCSGTNELVNYRKESFKWKSWKDERGKLKFDKFVNERMTWLLKRRSSYELENWVRC